MNLKQTLKALFIGFCYGFGLTWLLAILIPLFMEVNSGNFIHDCAGDILSISWKVASFSSLGWLLLTAGSRKRKRREELEDSMTEYFRKQNEKE